MQQLAAVPGRALAYVPREVLGWKEEDEDEAEEDQAAAAKEDAVVCCGAVQCLGLCYLCDVLGAVSTMVHFEEGLNKRSLPLFAFYEACWPCMRLAACCFCCFTREDVRALPRAYVPYLSANTFDAENRHNNNAMVI
jgi:hypothetical protein